MTRFEGLLIHVSNFARYNFQCDEDPLANIPLMLMIGQSLVTLCELHTLKVNKLDACIRPFTFEELSI